jgi:hypothetical protein
VSGQRAKTKSSAARPALQGEADAADTAAATGKTFDGQTAATGNHAPSLLNKTPARRRVERDKSRVLKETNRKRGGMN